MKLPETGFPPLDSREFLSFLRAKLTDALMINIWKNDGVQPDRDDIRDECLDDQPAQTKFHEAIRELKSPDVVKFLMEELMEELRQTLQLYVSQYFRGKEARS